MTNTNPVIFNEFYEYYRRSFIKEDPLLASLTKSASKLPGAHMQISAEQGLFLRFLTKLLKPQKILEIGTFAGYSALCFAMELPFQGKLITCDLAGPWLEVAKEFWVKAGVQDKISLKTGPALVTLKCLIDQQEEDSFDIAFIDADKQNYFLYFEGCLKLIRPGGVIIIDNVFWKGLIKEDTPHDKRAVFFKEFNQRLLEDKRIFSMTLPLSDGLTLALKI
jgi:predicted O-methyltransferase YrrM